MSSSTVIASLKGIESHASTLVGVADPQQKDVITSAVLVPARVMVKMAREAIDSAEAEFAEIEERVTHANERADAAEGKVAEAVAAKEAAEAEAASAKSALAAVAAAGDANKTAAK